MRRVAITLAGRTIAVSNAEAAASERLYLHNCNRNYAVLVARIVRIKNTPLHLVLLHTDHTDYWQSPAALDDERDRSAHFDGRRNSKRFGAIAALIYISFAIGADRVVVVVVVLASVSVVADVVLRFWVSPIICTTRDMRSAIADHYCVCCLLCRVWIAITKLAGVSRAGLSTCWRVVQWCLRDLW